MVAVCSCRGDPTNVDVPGRDGGRNPRTPRPRPQRRCRGRAGHRPSVRGDPWHPSGRRRRAGRRDLPGRDHPLPALPGLGAQRADGGARRAGGGGARPALAPTGPGHGGHRLRPLCPRGRPSASTSCSARSDIVSMHAPVTPETTGMIGTEQFAAMHDGVVYLNTARAALHDTDALVGRPRVGQGVGRRARPLRGGVPGPRPPAHHLRLGGAHPAHRRGHLRHRDQPHGDHRRGPLPAPGRGAAPLRGQPGGAGPA